MTAMMTVSLGREISPVELRNWVAQIDLRDGLRFVTQMTHEHLFTQRMNPCVLPIRTVWQSLRKRWCCGRIRTDGHFVGPRHRRKKGFSCSRRPILYLGILDMPQRRTPTVWY